MNFQNYEECLSFLYRRNQFAIKLGLNNIRKLIEKRGIDFNRSKFFHIAGTNGKGSVCHFISQYLKTRNYGKVGVYTSPHLVSFRERITIDEEVIPREWILDWMNSAQALIQQTRATFFECVTLMALEYFYEKHCDICILETGLGGRLDATNTVEPDITVLTSLSLDHQSILGDSLAEITREKLGILKKRVPLVLSESNPDILNQVKNMAGPLEVPVKNVRGKAGKGDAPGISALDEQNHYLYQDQFGDVNINGHFNNRPHLLHNLALSIYAVHIWESSTGRKVPPLASLRVNSLPGRIQSLTGKGLAPVILDCAHNQSSLQDLRIFLEQSFGGRRITLLFSVMKDKNLPAIFEQIFGFADCILFESLDDFDRSLKYTEFEVMKDKAAKVPCRSYNLAEENIVGLIKNMHPQKDLLVVAGSFYLLGKVIPLLCKKYPALGFFSQFMQDSSPTKIMV